jgi:hypothetical protein
VVVDEDRPEHALLGFEVVRKSAIHGNFELRTLNFETGVPKKEQPPVGEAYSAGGSSFRSSQFELRS